MARTIGTRSVRKVQPAQVLHAHATVDRRGEAGTVDAGGGTAVSGMRLQARNAGVPLDLGWVNDVRVNASAVERRAATMVARRTVKKEWQAAWLLRAITLIDLTTLAGDDTPGNVRRLCAKARQPVRADMLAALGAGHLGIQ